MATEEIFIGTGLDRHPDTFAFHSPSHFPPLSTPHDFFNYKSVIWHRISIMSEESPAQRSARLRRERREAKIKEGGSARLDKITSLSGRTPQSGTK
jgi:hypothetical protein